MKCGVFKYFCKIFIIISVVLLSSCDDRIREVDELYNSLFAKLENVSGEFCGHKYVDLGLPSGLMWATYNVGTTNPKGSGNYFSWDENVQNTKNNYNNLTPNNDIARSKWGGGWRMPTISEFEELSDYCKFLFVDYQGYKGVFVVSNINGNSIFMPTIDASGESGSYWSSSYYKDSKAYYAEFTDYGVSDYVKDIRGTLCVRAVCKDTENIPSSYTITFNANGGEGEMTSLKVWSDDASTMSIPSSTFTREGYEFIGWNTSADGTGSSYSDGQEISVKENITLYVQWKEIPTHNGYEYVDLGLPSGLKWATCNVGADRPDDYGSYFAWGETRHKANYNSETYNYTDNKTVLDLSDDAARVNWGGDWRMPTINEYKELITYCTFNWTSLNGVKGYKVTSVSNGNSIFLPAAGFRDGTYVSYAGSGGYYWSSSLYSSNSYYAYCLEFYSYDDVDWGYSRRYYGLTVRAVFQ